MHVFKEKVGPDLQLSDPCHHKRTGFAVLLGCVRGMQYSS